MNPAEVQALIDELKRRVSVMEAHQRGERIEVRYHNVPGFDEWMLETQPSWSWGIADYRCETRVGKHVEENGRKGTYFQALGVIGIQWENGEIEYR